MADKPLTGFPLLLLVIGLSIATFMIVLDYSIANVSIPYISGDLGVSVDQGTYVITSFAVGNAIALPVTGWLTKQVGGVKLIVLSLLLFTLFSWFCGAARDFQTLVVCRFIQGLVAGPLIPLSQSLIVSNNPPEKKNSALAFWSMIVITAPIVGPMLGGWISFDYTWPWIFYINVPICLASVVIIWTLLRKKETPIEKLPLDWVGLILLAVGVTCLQILLDKGQQFDWWNSYIIRTLGAGALVCLSLLIVWDWNHHKPLLELRLFKIRSFALSVILIGVSYAIYFGSVVLIPLWLQTNMGYNSIWAGLAVAPIGLAPLLFTTLTGKMITKIGVLIPLAICFVLFSVSSFYTAYFDTDVDFFHVGFSRFLLGCGILFYITPLFALSIEEIPNEKLPSATGIFHFVRAMVGGTGTSIFTTIWYRRTIYHHHTIGENITPYTPNIEQFLTPLRHLGIEGDKALAIFNTALDNQAAMLALNDCFFVMGWVYLVLVFILPLARKKRHLA